MSPIASPAPRHPRKRKPAQAATPAPPVTQHEWAERTQQADFIGLDGRAVPAPREGAPPPVSGPAADKALSALAAFKAPPTGERPLDATAGQDQSPDQDQSGELPGNVRELPPDIEGLGAFESVFASLPFDSDLWAVVRYHRPASYTSNARTTYRMVQIRQKKDPETKEITRVAIPVTDGRVFCTAISSHVTVDPRTRQIGSEQHDKSFTDTFQPNDSPINFTTTITATELNDMGKAKNFLTRLDLDSRVASSKYGAVRELLKAIHFNAPSSASHIRIIDRSGIVVISGQTCYANASGAVISPKGVVPNVRCEPATTKEQYEDVGYPVSMPSAKQDRITALNALGALFRGNEDLGLCSVLIGQLLAGPLTGTKMSMGNIVSSVTGIIGDSTDGKTAYAMLLFSSQTETLYGEAEPSMVVRCSPPDGSGGTTPAGISHALLSYGGMVALLDDAVKASWDVRHKRKAHDIILERGVSFILGAGASQAQSGGSRGGVSKAPDIRLYLSGCFTLETTDPITNLLKDSTYNRMALVWWDRSKRCTKAVFDTLKSKEQTAKRNMGLRITLDVILRRPEVLYDGYARALEALLPYVKEDRIAKAYARDLAGLALLDAAYAENGKETSYLTDSFAPTGGIARRMEASGTDGGDQLAASDIREATREAIRHYLSSQPTGLYAEARIPPEDAGKPMPSIPPPVTDLPSGVTMADLGWFADGTGDEAEWKKRASAVSLGQVIKSSAQKPHIFPYRLDMSPAQWRAVCDLVNTFSTQKRYMTADRVPRMKALEAAGAGRAIKYAGNIRYQLDLMWLLDDSEGCEK